MLSSYQLILKTITKKKINNKALNQVIDFIVIDKELLDKTIPRAVKERLGRR